MITPRAIAEECIRIYNGGMMRSNNSQWDLRLVELVVRQERDFVVKDKVLSDYCGGKPLEASMFTLYESQAVLWNDTGKYWYTDLPMGYLTVDDDRGIRVSPVVMGYGDNPFWRAAWGQIQNGTKQWAEGNILWSPKPQTVGGNRQIVYANVPASGIGYVNLEVIIGDSTLDIDAPSGIPDGLESVVVARVLQKMGFRRVPADRVNDNMEQLRGGQNT